MSQKYFGLLFFFLLALPLSLWDWRRFGWGPRSIESVEARPGFQEFNCFAGLLPEIQGSKACGVFQAVKEVLGGVIRLPEARAGGGGGGVDTELVGDEGRTVP